MAAISSCEPEKNEEEGGFLIKQEKTKFFEFHKVTNANTGSPRARAIYTADADEYGAKILAKTNTLKWLEYASFHTHPKGCLPIPSRMDLTELFLAFPINYIYSPDIDVLMCYTYDNENKLWQRKQIQTKRLK